MHCIFISTLHLTLFIYICSYMFSLVPNISSPLPHHLQTHYILTVNYLTITTSSFRDHPPANYFLPISFTNQYCYKLSCDNPIQCALPYTTTRNFCFLFFTCMLHVKVANPNPWDTAAPSSSFSFGTLQSHCVASSDFPHADSNSSRITTLTLRYYIA